MTNINPNNDVGKINYNIKKITKANGEKKLDDETKQVKASSLDVLNSYGKAKVTFKGSKPNYTDVPIEQVMQKLEALPDVNVDKTRFFSELRIPEKRIFADKILSEPLLYENPDFINDIYYLVSKVNKNDFTHKMGFLDKYLSNPDLHQNEILKKEFSFILNSMCHRGHAIFLDKVLSDPKLYQNDSIIITIRDNMFDIDDKENLQAKFGMIDYFFKEPLLFQSEHCVKNLGNIIMSVTTNKDIEIKQNFIQKILSSPKLLNNQSIKDSFHTLVFHTNTQEKLEARIKFLDKFISEPLLNENKSIQNYLDKILLASTNEKNWECKSEILDKYLFVGHQNKIIKNNIGAFLANMNSTEKSERANEFFDAVLDNKMSMRLAIIALKLLGHLDINSLKELEKTIPLEIFEKSKYDFFDIATAYKYMDFYQSKDINELSYGEKHKFLKTLLKENNYLFKTSDDFSSHFPLLPRTQDDYNNTLLTLTSSLKIQTNQVSTEQNKIFYQAVTNLSHSIKNISDEEFNALSISQAYSKDNFIQDVVSVTKNLSKTERQKVFDNFSFEICENISSPTRYSFIGYPKIPAKDTTFENDNIQQASESIKKFIIDYTENNKISCENKDIEVALNEIVSVMPEIRTLINKKQHLTHDFDVLKHSLKVMQKIGQNPQFEQLNENDKKILLIASLFHDCAKNEGNICPSHALESAFDSFYILQKLNLDKAEKEKIYSLIKNHEWLASINEKASSSDKEKQIKSVAFDLHYDNLFDLSKIFTEADLKAVKNNDSFFLNYKKDFENISKNVENLVFELKKTQPLLPTTKLPKASDVKTKITQVNDDFSTNIKGVYLKDGLVAIKYNEIEDWEALGFPQGSISKGIETVTPLNDKVNTGNIKFIVHALGDKMSLSRFNVFKLPDSDALLSVSYMERPESMYKLFSRQGVILNVDANNLYGGGDTSVGSGTKKTISAFKEDYAFPNSNRYSDRKFISELIKKALNLNDEEYINFIIKNKNKSMIEIEPKEVRETLIKELSYLNSNKQTGHRLYNEMYVSNPQIQGIFTTSPDKPIGDFSTFINNQQQFLIDYAKDNDFLYFIFGE